MSLQEFSGSSPKRRRAEEKDEGIGSPDTLEEEKVEELRREMLELRQQLDKERSARMQMEEQVRFFFPVPSLLCLIPLDVCFSGAGVIRWNNNSNFLILRHLTSLNLA